MLLCIQLLFISEIVAVVHGVETSNYNRANDVCMWKPTPITADATFTKIAGYDRDHILMNR